MDFPVAFEITEAANLNFPSMASFASKLARGVVVIRFLVPAPARRVVCVSLADNGY